MAGAHGSLQSRSDPCRAWRHSPRTCIRGFRSSNAHRILARSSWQVSSMGIGDVTAGSRNSAYRRLPCNCAGVIRATELAGRNRTL
jgi:hypothetical protein